MGGGTANVDGVFMHRNTAEGGSGSGGAILALAGSVNVSNSNLARNVADRAGGAIEMVDGTLVFADSFMRSNVAGSDDGSLPGNGGGYHSSGLATATFTGGAVLRNRAANEGGGMWVEDGGTLVVDGTVVGRNSAVDGGGIYSNGRVRMTGGALLRNSADNRGGGLYNDGAVRLDGTAVTRNSALAGGGAYTNTGADMTLSDVMFAGNRPELLGGFGDVSGDVPEDGADDSDG